MLMMFPRDTFVQNVRLPFTCLYQIIDLTFRTKMKIILQLKLVISYIFVNENTLIKLQDHFIPPPTSCITTTATTTTTLYLHTI